MMCSGLHSAALCYRSSWTAKRKNEQGSSSDHFNGGLSRGLAKLYPWALIAYLVLVFGQFVIGYFFNDWLMANMGTNVLFIIVLLLLAVISAFAHDVQETSEYRLFEIQVEQIP